MSSSIEADDEGADGSTDTPLLSVLCYLLEHCASTITELHSGGEGSVLLVGLPRHISVKDMAGELQAKQLAVEAALQQLPSVVAKVYADRPETAAADQQLARVLCKQIRAFSSSCYGSSFLNPMIGSFTCQVLHLNNTQRYVEIYSRVSADLSARCASQDNFVTVAFNCLQLVEGLNCLHTLGFIHCDLKPTNVGYECMACRSTHASTDSGTPGGSQGSAPPASTDSGTSGGCQGSAPIVTTSKRLGLRLQLQLPGSQGDSSDGGISSTAGAAAAGFGSDEPPAGSFQFTAVRILDWGFCRQLPTPHGLDGAPVPVTCGTPGWRLMDVAALPPGSSISPCTEVDTAAAGLVIVSMLLGTAGGLFTSVVAPAGPAGSGNSSSGMQPAHTHAHVANLLGSIDLLAAATPPALRPSGPGQLAARNCMLKYAQLLLQPEVRQVGPLLFAGASSDNSGVAGSSSGAGAESCAGAGATAGGQHRVLARFCAELRPLLGKMEGHTAQLLAAWHESCRSGSAVNGFMFNGQQFTVEFVPSRPPQLAVDTYAQRSIAEQLQGLSISTPRLKLRLTPAASTAQGAPVLPQHSCPLGPAHAAAAAVAVPPHTPTQTYGSQMGQPVAARGAVAGEKRDRASKARQEDMLQLASLGGDGVSSSDSQRVLPKRRVLLSPAEGEECRAADAAA